MKKLLLFALLLIANSFSLLAQDTDQPVEKVYAYQTFKDTRVINAHSVETLKKGMLDFRIGHRFGDIAGDLGGWGTFWGLENASDVLFGFEYGLSDNFMIGLSRTKGSGPLRQNINGLAKYKVAAQAQNGLPVTITFLGLASGSTMPSSGIEGDITDFAKLEHRFTYHGEVIIGRKFSNYFSLQGNVGWTYRNIVPALDQNDLLSVGLNARIAFSKSMALILDGRYVIGDVRSSQETFYAPIGIGLEWETGGGHVFQLNLTNARGILATDYIPYTTSNWLDGEYRLGFTIGRLFRI